MIILSKDIAYCNLCGGKHEDVIIMRVENEKTKASKVLKLCPVCFKRLEGAVASGTAIPMKGLLNFHRVY